MSQSLSDIMSFPFSSNTILSCHSKPIEYFWPHFAPRSQDNVILRDYIRIRVHPLLIAIVQALRKYDFLILTFSCSLYCLACCSQTKMMTKKSETENELVGCICAPASPVLTRCHVTPLNLVQGCGVGRLIKIYCLVIQVACAVLYTIFPLAHQNSHDTSQLHLLEE